MVAAWMNLVEVSVMTSKLYPAFGMAVEGLKYVHELAAYFSLDTVYCMVHVTIQLFFQLHLEGNNLIYE